ncbi:MAG: InlB B-repeat-containing protein [Paludibacteraceae bacterium]|nr:InlB B-repeat-containing protein [Paludibacteraceae bacterium]
MNDFDNPETSTSICKDDAPASVTLYVKPDSEHNIDAVTVTSGTASVGSKQDEGGGVYSYEISGISDDIEIEVSFEAKETFTVKYKNLTNNAEVIQNVVAGGSSNPGAISAVSNTGSCSSDYPNFVGWTKVRIDGFTTTKPSLNEAYTNVQDNNNVYYAVFTDDDNVVPVSENFASNVTLNASSNGVHCQDFTLKVGDVSNVSAVKIGATTQNGSYNINIPAGSTTLTMRVRGWDEDEKTASIEFFDAGPTITPGTITAKMYGGFGNSQTSHTLSAGDDLLTFTLSNVTTASQLTINTNGSRIVIYNVNVSGSSISPVPARPNVKKAAQGTAAYITNCPDVDIYLKTNADWRADNAKFAVYYWEGGLNGFSDLMTEQTDCEEGIYKTTIPSGYSNVIFGRFNSIQADPVSDWTNKWNKTSNLTLTGQNNYFTITGVSSDAYTGTWSEYAQKTTVSFDKNTDANGVTAPADQCVVVSTGHATEPTVASGLTHTVLGKSLGGWYENEAGTGPAWNFSTGTFAADKILYAKWNDEDGTQIYLKTKFGDNDWQNGNCIVFAHFYIDGTTQAQDVQMTRNSCDATVLEAIAPYGATHVSFARCKAGTASLGAEWNSDASIYNYVTGLALAADYYYSITGWGSNGQKVGTAQKESSAYTGTTYSISYDAGGGTGTMTATTGIVCGSSSTIKTNTFVKSGASFAGWYADVNVTIGGQTKTAGVDLIADGATLQNVASDITLTAQWADLPKYNITYNVASCASVSPTDAQSHVPQGDAIGTLPTPTAITGYTFYGWSLTEQTSETEVAPAIISTAYVPTSDTQLYAVYSRTTGSQNNTFTLIDSPSELVSGADYVIAAYYNNSDYAIKAETYSSYYIAQTAVTVSDDNVITNPAATIIWCITVENALSNTVSIYNANQSKYLDIITNGNYKNLVLDASKKTFTLIANDDGEHAIDWDFNSTTTSGYYISYDGSHSDFTTNYGAGSVALYLYKRDPNVFYTTAACKVLTPVISPADGTVLKAGSNTVTITCATAGASIYYTTDGTTPSSSNGTLYSASFTLNGATIVKAIAVKSGLDDSEVAEAEYGFGKEFVLATSTTTFEDGDEIVITNSDSNQALSTTQNDNNRGQTSVSAEDNKIIVDESGDVQIISLEKSGDNWLFNVGTDDYLYAASSSSNHLKTNTKSTVGDNGVWSITIAASTNVATITAQGTNTHNLLKYNSSSSMFSCYTSGQNDVKIYYYHRSDPYITITPSTMETFTYAVGYGPSLAQELTVKGYNLTGNLTVACPSGYELSATSPISGFSASNLTLTKDASNKVNTTIYVRLAAGKSAGKYDKTLTISGGGITAESVSLAGSVVAAPSGTRYQILTDEADLFPDDEIVIMNTEGTHIMSTTQNNNRGAIADGFSLLGSSVFVSGATVQTIVLDGCDDNWLFKVGTKWLYAAGSSENQLKSADNEGTASNGNGLWKVEVNDLTLESSVTAPQSSNRNVMQYNGTATNKVFSVYETLQYSPLKLYAKPSATANVCGSPSVLSGFTAEYSKGASVAQSYSVKGRNLTGSITVSAPTGYEVSTAEDGTYAGSVTLSPTDGKVAPVTLWVRLKADNNAGSYNGDITISATGATTRTIALTGTVSCTDPGLAFTSEVNGDSEHTLMLSASSITSDNAVLTSLSNGAYTITMTHEDGDDENALSFSTSTFKFTATAEGIWTVKITQAASTNYCASSEDGIECTVYVMCDNPAAPTNLHLTDIRYNGATLTWDAVDGAAAYAVIVSGKTGGGDASYTETYSDLTETEKSFERLKPGCTYECYVEVTNSCGKRTDSEVTDLATIFAVTYHASGEEDHIVGVADGGSVPAYSPVIGCGDKVFVGWASSDVTTLQQSDPTTNATGAIASVTANTDLYAVYAARNGGKEQNTQSNIINETWTRRQWNETNHIVRGAETAWTTDVSSNPFNSFTISSATYACVMFDVKDVAQHYLISERKFTDLKQIEVKGNSRDGAAVNCYVYVSADKTTWTTLTEQTISSTSSSISTLNYEVPTVGDYYIKIALQSRNDLSGSSYKVGITGISAVKADKTYYLTDYSTTCTKAASATVTWTNGSGNITVSGSQPSSPAIGTWLTMPALRKDNYRFDGWKATIEGNEKSEVYLAGEKFLVNHNVTFTAQWTELFSVTEPEYGVTSYKTVATTSLPATLTVKGTLDVTPVVDGLTDATHFAVTVGAGTNNGDDKDFTYTFTYTPDAFGTGSGADTHTAAFRFKDAASGAVSGEVTIRGRSLPEEFVIAVKHGDKWVALPSDLAATESAQSAIIPYEITVDNTTTPTAAVYAPNNAVYKAANRYNSDNNTALRFTNDGSHWLQVSGTDTGYKMWLSSSGGNKVQDWQLKSADFNSYELTIPSNAHPAKKMGIYSDNYMGYHGSPSSAQIYLLPVTNKYTPRLSTVTEWGKNNIIVAPATVSDIAKAKVRIDGGTLSEFITPAPVNVATIAGAKNIQLNTALDFTANENKCLYIEWYNSSNELVGTSNISIPLVLAGNNTMSTISNTKASWRNTHREVHLLPGATLTADASSFTGDGALTIRQLEVYPGATLNVSTGTLAVTDLNLRSGWTRASGKQYNTPRVYVKTAASLEKTRARIDMDIYDQSEGKHYYPLAVPFPVAVNAIDYADSYLADFSNYGANGQYVIKEYDGARRAQSGPDINGNWKPVAEGATLQPGKGYILTAVAVKGEAVIRVPLTYDNAWTANGEQAIVSGTTKNQVSVTAYTGTAAESHKRNAGWNMLGVPFLSCYTAGTDMYSGDALIKGQIQISSGYEYTGDVPYVSVPSHDFAEYIQTAITDTKLRPEWSFFVQVGKTGTITFKKDNQTSDNSTPIYAPRKVVSQHIYHASVLLTDGEAEDKANLIISDRYSTDYEVGADLEKMFGSGGVLRLYTISDGTRLVYNALPATAAEEIPVGYIAPKAGRYMFLLPEDADMSDIEAVYLTDHLENRTVDLMWVMYEFDTEAGQNDTRFTLSVVLRAPEITTGQQELVNVAGGGWDFRVSGAEKSLLIRDVPHGAGVYVFSAEGKLLREWQQVEERGVIEAAVPSSGVYSVRVINGGDAKTHKAIVK